MKKQFQNLQKTETSKQVKKLQIRDEVALIIENETPLGYNVLINDEYEGLLYHDEIFMPLEEGMAVTGYVKKLRFDGKIDVSLRPHGYDNAIEADVQTILLAIKKNNGHLLLTDKSTPDAIREQLNMSKKAFKKAVGNLYKQKLITIDEDRITLITAE